MRGELMKANSGVIYYNSGRKMIVRLAVSLHSLRKVYQGPVTLLIDGEGKEDCIKIAREYNCDAKEAGYTYDVKNCVYLNACKSGQATPYDLTVWIDSDTVILKSFDELFDYAEQHEFAISQFSTWRTESGQIRRRITAWKNIYPDLMEKAISFGPAINCGVFSFRKDSALMRDWYDLALPGYKTFIPDEVCCQIMLHKYPHIILSPEFNTSCKYGKIDENTMIIHFHGRKHCRISKGVCEHNSGIWYKEFEEVRDNPVVKSNINNDRMLRNNIDEYNKL
jgi:hypothetical protein